MRPSFAQKNAHTEDYCHNPPNKILQLSRLTSSSRIAIVLASGDARLFVQTDVWCPNKSTQRIFGSFNTYKSIARNDTTFLTHSDMFANLLVFSWYQICEFLSSLFFSLSELEFMMVMNVPPSEKNFRRPATQMFPKWLRSPTISKVHESRLGGPSDPGGLLCSLNIWLITSIRWRR